MQNRSLNNELLTPHFALLEFTESATARKHGIRNSPPQEAVRNLSCLCRNVLEPLREAMGLPVIITSGYRCKALNDIVSHRSNRSQHLVGRAADFYVGWSSRLNGRGPSTGSGTRERLIKAFRYIITNLDYDQLILYPTFIHVSYASPEANRHYIMTTQGNGKYRRVTREVALTIS